MKRTQVMGGLLAAVAIALHSLGGPADLLAGKGGKGGGGGSGGGGPTPTPLNYTITYINPLKGATEMSVGAMNNNTEVLGNCTLNNQGRAFVYSAGSTVNLTDQFQADGLAAPDGGPIAFDEVSKTGWLVVWAKDINDSGQIVCVLIDWSNGTFLSEALTRYTPARASSTGTPKLDVLDFDYNPNVSWPGQLPFSINNNGDVVGGNYLWTDAHVDSATGWLIANPLPHFSGGVNDDDGTGHVQVIGDNHRYTVDIGTLEITDDFDLGTLYPSSRYKNVENGAAGINNSGDVAANSSYTSLTGSFTRVGQASRYTDSQGLIGLGTLGGSAGSGAFGINNYGDVVGLADTSAGDWHIFLYSDAFGGMTDVSAALPSGVVLVSSSIAPSAINDNGEICGTTPDQQNGWILTPQP